MFGINYFATRYFSPYYFATGLGAILLNYGVEAAQVFTPGMGEGAGQVR